MLRVARARQRQSEDRRQSAAAVAERAAATPTLASLQPLTGTAASVEAVVPVVARTPTSPGREPVAAHPASSLPRALRAPTPPACPTEDREGLAEARLSSPEGQVDSLAVEAVEERVWLEVSEGVEVTAALWW